MITAEQGPAKNDGTIQRNLAVGKKDPERIADGVPTAEAA
jgi:hypothetical protein